MLSLIVLFWIAMQMSAPTWVFVVLWLHVASIVLHSILTAVDISMRSN